MYDMTCYPKNQSGNPTLDKLVRQSQNNGGDALYNSTESVSEGDVLDYILISKLPHITSRATWLTEYSFRDVLSKGLTYNQDVKIALYHDAEAAKSNLLKKADAVWTGDMFSQNYRKDTKTGDTIMDVDLTDQGLAAIMTVRMEFQITTWSFITLLKSILMRQRSWVTAAIQTMRL